jgi:hypothetical protein
MPKLTLTDLTTLSNDASAVAAINANMALIETAVENTLSRDGTSPNTMTADLDMNSQDILNGASASFTSLTVGGETIDDLVDEAAASATAAAASATAADNSATAAAISATAADASADAAAISASSIELPVAVADTMLVRNAGNTAYETKTASQVRTFLNLVVGSTVQAWNTVLDSLASASANGISLVQAANYAAMKALLDLEIGVDVQAYDADTAKTDVAQTWTANQRKALTSDNDGSFDLSAGPDFTCTPTGGVTIAFTNQASGYKGTILFNNTTAYAIAKGANIYAPSTMTTDLSITGRREISYVSDGTNVWLSYTELLS